MAKKRKTSVTPTTAAAASGCPPPASELSAQVAIQHLKALNSFLLKETLDLRGQIMQLHSNLAAVSADHCIDQGISSHLASTVEGCAALLLKADDDLSAEKAAAEETTASLVKKADASAAELSLAKTMLLSVSREKDAIARDLERVVEERDLSRSDLDEKRMKLEYLEEKLIAAEAECRKLEEEGKSSEKSLQYAMHEISSLKTSLEQKNVLTVKLTRENEKMKEEGKIREESLHSATLEIDSLRRKNERMKEEGKIGEESLHSATFGIDSLKRSLKEMNDLIVKLEGDNEKRKEERKMKEEFVHSAVHATSSPKGLFEEKIQLTAQLVRENEEVKNRKEVDMMLWKLFKAVLNKVAKKIFSLEEKCSNLNEIRNQLTDEIYNIQIALDKSKQNLIDGVKQSK